MASTPLRNIRVDDERWARWQAAAESRLTTVTELVKEAVDRLLVAEGVEVEPPVFRTKSGRVLTDADIQQLAHEAELGELTFTKPDVPTYHDQRRDRYSRESVEATEAGVTPGAKTKGGGARKKVGGVSGSARANVSQVLAETRGRDLASREVTPQFKKPK